MSASKSLEAAIKTICNSQDLYWHTEHGNQPIKSGIDSRSTWSYCLVGATVEILTAGLVLDFSFFTVFL